MKVVAANYLFEREMGQGAVTAVERLVDGLVGQGIEVVVISTHGQRRMTVEHTDGVTIYRFLPWNLYWLADKDREPTWRRILWQLIDIWNPHAFQVVKRILERERPDIFHVHKLRGLSASIWAAAQSCGNIPIVQTCHDYELISPEGTFGTQGGITAREGAWFVRLYSRLRARFSRVVTAAVGDSRYTLDKFIKHEFFPRAVKRVIPCSHGLALAELNRRREEALAAHSIHSGPLRLLFVGRLETIKGVDVLCEAFQRCAARFPDVRLDIVGWGTQGRALKERYGEHPQITFHGLVPDEDRDHMLDISDVLVVPSVWEEVFGVVIIEAYAHGRPVVVARSGGMPELVREGETGFVVPAGDVPALADKVCQLAAAPDAVRAMSSACFQAARRYAPELVASEYRSLYEQLLGWDA